MYLVSYRKDFCHLIIYCFCLCTNSDKLRIVSKSVTMLMTKNMCAENFNKLGEFTFNRPACGRGGEQLFFVLTKLRLTHYPDY